MSSTTTLRNDVARTGTNPYFPLKAGPWHKYSSIDLGAPVRAGVLVVQHWRFDHGPHHGETHTLVLVSTTTNEIYCYSEKSLLAGGSPPPLWHTSLGVPPVTRGGSNIAPPIGVCGTPVIEREKRRMFVVAASDNGAGGNEYTIFDLSLDTGHISRHHKLVDPGASGRATFDPSLVDQRTAINLVHGWLWLGFADFLAYDLGRYYGWAVAIDPDKLNHQLYHPMVSQNSSNNWGVFAGGIWGPGGMAADDDGAVYALTGNATQLDPGDVSGNNPHDDLNSFGMNYWANIPAPPHKGPGTQGDYFNGLVRLSIKHSGPNARIEVLDWFQGSTFTQAENSADFDFGGSSPVVLPEIDERQLVAFVPKDGDIFVLDSGNLGHYTKPLTRQTFANALINGGNDTKVAIAFVHTHHGHRILIVGADSNGSFGGFAAFQIDAAATPPTLTKLWQAPSPLRDSFGSPIVIASHEHHINPVCWVIDGDDAADNFLKNCAMRAYDVITGAVAYDSTVHGDITEEIPHFCPITSGGHSVFCATSKGFIGFTQT
jgi:hypothetical protein